MQLKDNLNNTAKDYAIYKKDQKMLQVLAYIDQMEKEEEEEEEDDEEEEEEEINSQPPYIRSALNDEFEFQMYNSETLQPTSIIALDCRKSFF